MTSLLIHRVFELSLLLNLTSISVYIPTLGIPGAPVAVAFVLVNLLYLGLHWPVARRLLSKRSILEWMVYLLVWPVVFTLLLALARAPLDLVTAAKFHLTITSLVLASGVYVYREGWERFRKLAALALAIAAIGFVGQWLVPGLFQRYTAEGGMPDFQGRTHGFFGGPNAAAQGVAMLTVVTVATLRKTGNLAKFVPVLLMLAMAVATGSRSGMALTGVVALVLAWQMKGSLHLGGRRLLPGVGAGGLAAAGLILGVVGFVALGWLGSMMKEGKYPILGERILFWTQVGSAGDVLQDQSLASRLEAQFGYAQQIAERPILGYGPVMGRELVYAGELARTSHNTFFANAFEYGIFYALLLAYVLWRLFTTKAVLPAAAPIARVASNIVLIIAISSLATAGIFLVRSVMVCLGAVLAATAFQGRALKIPTADVRPRTRPALGRPVEEGGVA